MMFTLNLRHPEIIDVYPSDITIKFDDGDEAEVTLYWWATEVGTHTVTLAIDPSRNYEFNPEDNHTVSRLRLQNEVEPTLRFMQGAYQTVPLIPNPDQPYTVIVRVDVLAKQMLQGYQPYTPWLKISDGQR